MKYTSILILLFLLFSSVVGCAVTPKPPLDIPITIESVSVNGNLNRINSSTYKDSTIAISFSGYLDRDKQTAIYHREVPKQYQLPELENFYKYGYVSSTSIVFDIKAENQDAIYIANLSTSQSNTKSQYVNPYTFSGDVQIATRLGYKSILVGSILFPSWNSISTYKDSNPDICERLNAIWLWYNDTWGYHYVYFEVLNQKGNPQKYLIVYKVGTKPAFSPHICLEKLD